MMEIGEMMVIRGLERMSKNVKMRRVDDSMLKYWMVYVR